jgi:hypothetical protein
VIDVLGAVGDSIGMAVNGSTALGSLSQSRRSRAPPDDFVVRLTPAGRLEWVVPASTGDRAPDAHHAFVAARPTHGAEIVSAAEEALIEANRAKLAELQSRAYPSPDLADGVLEIMERAIPDLKFAACVWALQFTGLIPLPALEGGALATGAFVTVGRRMQRHVRAAQVPSTAHGDGVAPGAGTAMGAGVENGGLSRPTVAA